ncbi:hypothetical protein GCM10027167_17460 [Nocardia heshunensis]
MFEADPTSDRIESQQWLSEFVENYAAAWKSMDGKAVTEYAAEDVIWSEPSISQPARGRRALAEFVDNTVRTFPDLSHASPFPPAITGNADIAIVPWRMTGTNRGPIEPPGFAPTGKSIDLLVLDIWQFRGGLISQCRSIWNLAEMLEQLGIMPPRGSAGERAFAQAQKWRYKLGF